MNQFENTVKPFCHITTVPVTFYDPELEAQWECFSGAKICSFFDDNKKYQNICRRSLLSSTKTAEKLGEPYIFLCPAGLVNIAVSLIVGGTVMGTLIAGPLAMGNQKEITIKNLLKNIPKEVEIGSGLIVFLSELKIYKPKDVAFLASLFYSTVLSSIIDQEDYKKRNEKYKEQTNFGERIQKYKKHHKQLDYPHQLEQELINKVKNGDKKGTSEILTVLLNEISLIESGNLSFIKIRVIGICSILARINVSNNTPIEISSQEIENMDLLNKAESFKDLFHITLKIVDSYTSKISDQRYTGNSSMVRQAAQYINKNYMNKITLKSVAGELHTNQSYLSTLFKKEMKIAFTDYLNDIRTKRSEDLLTGTNLSLVEIALCCGFEDQSYYTKMFKKKNGITPSQYRKINQLHNLK